MDNKCVFCLKDNVSQFFLKNTGYGHCTECGGYFLLPEFRLTPDEQKKRYLKHNNTMQNEGYVDFLQSFIDPVLEFYKEAEHPADSGKLSVNNSDNILTRILDYGSGPEPVLVELLETYRKEGELFRKFGIKECEIRGWDPFFAPEAQFFEGGADLVTCLEVAEHFESPDEDFAKLSSCVKPEGILAVGTMLAPPGGEEAFKNWWYRSDATHVSFYTENSLRSVASRHGLSFASRLSDRIFVFKKD